MHGINTRNRSNLHQSLSCLTSYQKGPYYFGIEVFNSLPSHIKVLPPDVKQFKSALKDFLYVHSFYSLDEYFNYNNFQILKLLSLLCFNLILSNYFTSFIFIYCPVTLTYFITTYFHVLVFLYLVI
jgi:hypothetical protein